MRIVVTENGPKSPPKETNPYKWEVLIAVVPGTVMCAMDFGIAYIAFPTMISVFTGYKHYNAGDSLIGSYKYEHDADPRKGKRPYRQ